MSSFRLAVCSDTKMADCLLIKFSTLVTWHTVVKVEKADKLLDAGHAAESMWLPVGGVGRSRGAGPRH